MEMKRSTLEVLVVHFLQFSLWKPSYLLTESLCTETPSLACPAVCSAHLWGRFGFDKNYGDVILLTWGGNRIQQEYSAFQSEGSPSIWQTDTRTSQQEHWPLLTWTFLGGKHRTGRGTRPRCVTVYGTKQRWVIQRNLSCSLSHQTRLCAADKLTICVRL